MKLILYELVTIYFIYFQYIIIKNIYLINYLYDFIPNKI